MIDLLISLRAGHRDLQENYPMKTLIRPAVTLFILLSIVTGLIYPLLVTGIGQALFPNKPPAA